MHSEYACKVFHMYVSLKVVILLNQVRSPAVVFGYFLNTIHTMSGFYKSAGFMVCQYYMMWKSNLKWFLKDV